MSKLCIFATKKFSRDNAIAENPVIHCLVLRFLRAFRWYGVLLRIDRSIYITTEREKYLYVREVPWNEIADAPREKTAIDIFIRLRESDYEAKWKTFIRIRMFRILIFLWLGLYLDVIFIYLKIVMNNDFCNKMLKKNMGI